MAPYRDTESDSGLEVSQPGLEVPGTRPPFHQGYKEAVPIQDLGDDSHFKNDASTFHPAKSQNPFGLSPLVFGVLVALVTSIFLGAALGGGLGSAIHSSNKGTSCSPSATTTLLPIQTVSYSSPTPTTSLTNYVVAPPASIDSLSLPYDCPALSSQTYNSHQNDVFSFNCGVDYMGNDVVAIVAYSLYDCCDACSNMNVHLTGSNQCKALTFQANMSWTYANDVPPGGANCWLKNASDSGTTGEVGIIIGAIMESS